MRSFISPCVILFYFKFKSAWHPQHHPPPKKSNIALYNLICLMMYFACTIFHPICNCNSFLIIAFCILFIGIVLTKPWGRKLKTLSQLQRIFSLPISSAYTMHVLCTRMGNQWGNRITQSLPTIKPTDFDTKSLVIYLWLLCCNLVWILQ